MARPITLFTGQWADLPSRSWRRKPPPRVSTGWSSPAGKITSRSTGHSPTPATSSRGGSCSTATASSASPSAAHLVAQAVCDRIDEPHRVIVPAEVWGDGDPEGVRQRAAERMKHTARDATVGVTQVNGFTDLDQVPDRVRALNRIGCQGPLSSGRTRGWIASGARRTRSPSCGGSSSSPSVVAFDVAMQRTE